MNRNVLMPGDEDKFRRGFVPTDDLIMAGGGGTRSGETEATDHSHDRTEATEDLLGGTEATDQLLGGTEATDRRNGNEISDFGTAKSMEPEIYRAAIAGDSDGLRRALEDTELNLLNQVTPRGDTVLHIAASLGHHHLVEPILSRCPDLFKSKNSTDDNPLHLAASGGHLSTLQSLICDALRFTRSSASSEDGAAERIKNGLNGHNKDRNTPLHLALKNHHYEVAEVLYEAAPEASYSLNLDGKSPLYMTAEAGHQHLFELMMQLLVSTGDAQNKLKDGKPLVHAAIRTRNKVALETALRYESSLIDSADIQGRKPLSYAASIGYFDGDCTIMDRSVECAYKRDRDGSYPIHKASSKGHIRVIQEFLRRCPDSRELVTHGQRKNILHVAAEVGKANIVSYMLKVPELEMLINEGDEKGNTPLHLARKNAHPKVVSILTWDNRVNLDLEDSQGFTALDAAVNYKGTMPTFQERLTWLALRHASAPRARPPVTTKENKRCLSVETYSDRVSTFLLVATLVATVTFAAGFTVPGGYNGSDPHKGVAVMVEKLAFHIFVISDTIAMYSSTVVTVALIWAQLGDLSLVIASLRLAVPLLGVALTMVSLAFMAGVYLAVSSLNWLAYVVLIIGSIFLLTLLILLVPLFLPSSLNNQMLRYIFYYPFSLLIFVTQKSADDVDSDK